MSELMEVQTNILTDKLEDFAKGDPLVARLNLLPLGEILSYKELCSFLGEEEVAGDSRKAQRRRWDKYMVLEPVGRKLMIKQVFSPKEFLIEKDFNSDEEHLYNSALLLQEYLVDMVGAADETSIKGIYSLTMFNKDVATVCGYIPEKYYHYRRELENGVVYGEALSTLQNYFTKVVRTEISDTIRKLLVSLEKKKLLVIKKVYIGVEKQVKTALSEEEVVQYNSILLAYAKEVNKGKLIGLNTHSMKFQTMLRNAGLEYVNIYTGYQMFYKEEDLRNNIELEKKNAMVMVNNRLLKGRVRKQAEKDESKAWKDGSKGVYLQNAFCRTDAMDDIDWLLEEFLTYGVIQSKE